MKLSDFSNAKVRDKIWDMVYQAYVEIERIDGGYRYPFILKNGHSMTEDGRHCLADKCSRYYWHEIKFEVPPPPKRIIKETWWTAIENINKLEKQNVIGSLNLYKNKDELIKILGKNISDWKIMPIEIESEE